MKEIKHKTTGKVLKVIEADTLRKADLRGSDLSFSDLRGSDLRGAKGEFIFNWGVKLKVAEEKEC